MERDGIAGVTVSIVDRDGPLLLRRSTRTPRPDRSSTPLPAVDGAVPGTPLAGIALSSEP